MNILQFHLYRAATKLLQARANVNDTLRIGKQLEISPDYVAALDKVLNKIDGANYDITVILTEIDPVPTQEQDP